VSGRNFAAERERRSDERAAKEVGTSRCALRQAEHVQEADPEVFEQLDAGIVSLPEEFAGLVVAAAEARHGATAG
jgi:hypothetical protein